MLRTRNTRSRKTAKLLPKTFFLCSTSLQKIDCHVSYIYISADVHYRNQCDKMINNINQGIFIF